MASTRPSIYESLLQAAIERRAVAMEEWFAEHWHCDPRPYIDQMSEDCTTVRTKCSCGKITEFTLITTLDVRTLSKR